MSRKINELTMKYTDRGMSLIDARAKAESRVKFEKEVNKHKHRGKVKKALYV